MEKTIIIATQNLGKLKEFEIALSSFFDTFLSLKTLNDRDEVDENGNTYQANAHLKAKYFFDKYKMPVIADDSGLEVMTLEGYPGIYSARIGKDDTERRQIILKKLESSSMRKAEMITHITYIDETGIYDFESRVEGMINEYEEGTQGFGYDTIFRPTGYQQTFGLMHPKDKLKVSHRGLAIQALIQFLRRKNMSNTIENEIMERVSIGLNVSKENVKIIERLKGGVSHYTYHVSVDKNDYTYRKIGEGGNLFVDRKTEFQMIIKIEPLNINSDVIVFDIETGEKISKFVKGTPLNLLDYNQHLDALVGTLKKLHQSDIENVVDYGLINRLSLYESYTNQRTPLYQELKLFWIEKYQQQYESNGKVFCHNDAQRSNIVIGEERLYLLDWEYAGLNEFYYDIASFGNVDFNDALILLDHYLGRKATLEEQNHVRFYRMFQTLQWHQVALYKHMIGLGEKIQVDFKALALKYLQIAESFKVHLES
jgi:non-canonical purine NTP pyrophosphatase (RdgB/HAM1 family)